MNATAPVIEGNLEEKAKKLARNWSLLYVLYPHKELDYRALLSATSLRPSDLSKALADLESSNLLFVRRQKNPKGGQPVPYSKLTEYSRIVIRSFTSEIQERIELGTPDRGLFKVILRELEDDSPNVGNAWNEFYRMATSSKLWETEAVWEPLDRELLAESPGAHAPDALCVLSIVLEGAKSENVMGVVNRTRVTYLANFEARALEPDGPWRNMRAELLTFLKLMKGDEEFLTLLWNTVEKSVITCDDDRYTDFMNDLTRFLRSFISTHRRQLLEKVFRLGRNSDIRVQERAKNLYVRLFA